MNNVHVMYHIVEDRLAKGLQVGAVLLPEHYVDADDGTYIDGVLSDFMEGIGAGIDNWAIRNMFLSYGVSEEVADRAMWRLVGKSLKAEAKSQEAV